MPRSDVSCPLCRAALVLAPGHGHVEICCPKCRRLLMLDEGLVRPPLPSPKPNQATPGGPGAAACHAKETSGDSRRIDRPRWTSQLWHFPWAIPSAAVVTALTLAVTATAITGIVVSVRDMAPPTAAKSSRDHGLHQAVEPAGPVNRAPSVAPEADSVKTPVAAVAVASEAPRPAALVPRGDVAVPAERPARPPRPTAPPIAATAAASLADAVDRVRGSVVTILCDDGFGSGFLVRGQRWIATNHHVIAGASTARAVRRAGEATDGLNVEIIGFVACDPGSDLAVLVLAEDWPGAPLPLAKEKPRLGEDVFAVGTPKGLDETVTRGIVSQIRTAAELRQGGLARGTAIIQTDTFVTHGSSGGPLCSTTGAVVGINSFVRKGDAEQVEFHFAVAATELERLLRGCDGRVRPLSQIPPRRD